MGNSLYQSSNRKTLIEYLTDSIFVLIVAWTAILVGLVMIKPEIIKAEINEYFFLSLKIFSFVTAFLASVLLYCRKKNKAGGKDCLVICQFTSISALNLTVGVLSLVMFCLSLAKLLPYLIAMAIDNNAFNLVQVVLYSLFMMFFSCIDTPKTIKLYATGIQMPMGVYYEWEKVESYRWLDAYLSSSDKRDLQYVLKKNGAEVSFSIPEQHVAQVETLFGQNVPKNAGI